MAAIRITGSNTSTGDLTLQDSNGNSATNFNAQRGHVITWEIQPGSGVSAITGFAQENVNGNTNVFSSYPAQQGNSSNWQGTVDANLSSGNSYTDTYEINWQDAQGNSHTYDPKIQVNPIPAS
ncbi:MAG TPA: hypothetical protein VN726_11880 [Hanamia sp.]|nr:hypothetical protein [Hanamia sp.]